MATKRKSKFKTLQALFKDRKRWMKGDYENGEGAYCLVGGLIHVYGDTDAYGEASCRIESTLRKLNFVTRLVEFNDHPKTTFKDIQKVVRLAKV